MLAVITLFLQTLAFYHVNDVKIHTSEQQLKDLGSVKHVFRSSLGATFQNFVMFLRHIFVHFAFLIPGLQPRDKAAMLGVKTIDFFLEEFT